MPARPDPAPAPLALHSGFGGLDGEALQLVARRYADRGLALGGERFGSRSQDRDGVGLGLYIVKTILNNHGEDIAVTSRQGVTDFVFTLALKP